MAIAVALGPCPCLVSLQYKCPRVELFRAPLLPPLLLGEGGLHACPHVSVPVVAVPEGAEGHHIDYPSAALPSNGLQPPLPTLDIRVDHTLS